MTGKLEESKTQTIQHIIILETNQDLERKTIQKNQTTAVRVEVNRVEKIQVMIEKSENQTAENQKIKQKKGQTKKDPLLKNKSWHTY